MLTTRWGIFRALWILGLLQALSNLGYALAAAADLGRPGIYTASLIESFTGGLGTAAFLAFLMHVCDKRRAATEYALLSAIFGFTRRLAGTFSGWGTTHLGYAVYFSVTFVLALAGVRAAAVGARLGGCALPARADAGRCLTPYRTRARCHRRRTVGRCWCSIRRM